MGRELESVRGRLAHARLDVRVPALARGRGNGLEQRAPDTAAAVLLEHEHARLGSRPPALDGDPGAPDFAPVLLGDEEGRIVEHREPAREVLRQHAIVRVDGVVRLRFEPRGLVQVSDRPDLHGSRLQ